MRFYINSLKNRIDEITNKDFHEKLQEHFEKMFNVNTYFNERIDMTVLFDIYGPDGGKWIVNFSQKPYLKIFRRVSQLGG